MKMYTIAANDMRSLETEANRKGVTKEQIVNIFQAIDGTYTLVYYKED